MTQWCSRSVYSVEGISPDGQYLALVSYGLQGYVILLNINAGQIIGVYPASYVNHLRFQRMVENICYGEERVDPTGQDALA